MNIHLFRQRPADERSQQDQSIRVSEILGSLREAIAGFEREVCLDLGGVIELSSEELREIIRLHLSLSEQERHLVLVNARGRVADTIAITRLDRMVEVRNPAELV